MSRKAKVGDAFSESARRAAIEARRRKSSGKSKSDVATEKRQAAITYHEERKKLGPALEKMKTREDWYAVANNARLLAAKKNTPEAKAVRETYKNWARDPAEYREDYIEAIRDYAYAKDSIMIDAFSESARKAALEARRRKMKGKSEPAKTEKPKAAVRIDSRQRGRGAEAVCREGV